MYTYMYIYMYIYIYICIFRSCAKDYSPKTLNSEPYTPNLKPLNPM